MQGLIVVEDTNVSRCCESFVCNGTFQYRTTGDTPITQSGISPLVSLVSRDSQLSQVGHIRFGLLPLLPDIHSEPAPQPFIPRHQRPLHICCPEVADPASDKHFHFLHHSADIAPAVSLCKNLQRFLCLGKRLSVRTDIDALIILAQTKSKKLEILLCKDAGHLALFRVHFQLQLAFQILPQDSNRRSAAHLLLANTTMSSAYRTSFTPLRLISQSNSLRLIFACKGDKGAVSKTIFQNRSRQPLFLAHAKEKATNYTPKTVHKTRGAGFASQKSVLFSFFIRYAAPGTNRWFPNRPVCILWCSFSMLKAILTRYHSTITLALPLVRKRRKFMSSLTMANTPSA